MGLHQRAGIEERQAGAGLWIAPVALSVVAVLFALGGDVGREWLRYEYDAIGAGELWRLLTGHLVHLGPSHLALNLAGLALILFLVRENLSTGRFLALFLVSTAGIDAGFWLFGPQLEWYVGLSGVLHGLFAGGLVLGFRRRRIETLALLVILAAKLGWEQAVGPLPGSESTAGGPVITEAHLYGAIAGLVAGVFLAVGRRLRPI